MQACPDPLAFQRDVEALFRTSCDILSPVGINVDLVRSVPAPHVMSEAAESCGTRGRPLGAFPGQRQSLPRAQSAVGCSPEASNQLNANIGALFAA